MGSLIFVVVLLIWATYLSLYVARRREQVSTARSVDRFSSHMRVLQRRMVKEAAPAEEAAPSSGNTRSSILAAGALEHDEQPAGTARPGMAPTSRTERGVAAARAYLGSVHSNRAFAAWGGLTGALDGVNPRRLRAYALLTFLLAGGISFVLAALGRTSWLLPALCAAGVFGLLAWLRSDRMAVLAARERRATADRSATEREALSQQRARTIADEESQRRAAQSRPEAGEFPVAQESAPARARSAYEFFDLAVFDESATAGSEAPASQPATSQPTPSRSTTMSQPTVSQATPSQPSAPAVDPVAQEKLWQPVPVPPPTYTLKARADHPVPVPLATPTEPVPIEVEDDFEDALWRQNAVGS